MEMEMEMKMERGAWQGLGDGCCVCLCPCLCDGLGLRIKLMFLTGIKVHATAHCIQRHLTAENSKRVHVRTGALSVSRSLACRGALVPLGRLCKV